MVWVPAEMLPKVEEGDVFENEGTASASERKDSRGPETIADTTAELKEEPVEGASSEHKADMDTNSDHVKDSPGDEDDDEEEEEEDAGEEDEVEVEGQPDGLLLASAEDRA